MAISTAEKQELLDELERAILEGARTVKYSDREVTYRSLAEMEQTRERLRRELGIAKAGHFRNVVRTSKGLE